MATPTTLPDVVTLVQIQAALERCMQAHPPTDVARVLHPEADRIATLWATLHLSRVTHIDTGQIDQRQRDALRSWF
jgi:hypothetical protein